MNKNFLQDLRKHYDCIKEKNFLLQKPTEKNLQDLFAIRTNGLTLDDFRKSNVIIGDKQAKIKALNESDIAIIEKFINAKDKNQTNIFKPFSNFLRNKSELKKTVAANFLAFLLDFPYRPYEKYYLNKENEIKYECKEISLPNEPADNKLALKPIPTYLFVLFIVLLTIIVLASLKTIFQNNNPEHITINNKTFNTHNNYYYYRNKDGLKIISQNELTDSLKPKVHPVTPAIFDTYFNSQGIDTSSNNYKIIKTKYFENKPTPEIFDASAGSEDNYEVQKVTRITGAGRLRLVQQSQQKQENEKPGTQQKFSVNIFNNNQPDDKVAGIIREKLIEKYGKTATCKGKSTYTFKKSDKYAKRSICRLEVDYQIKSDKNEVLDNKHYVLIGTGFSDEAAKNNALMKLKTIIQE